MTVVLGAAAAPVRVESVPPAGVCGPDMEQLHRRYPPRPVSALWPGTCADRDQVLARLLAPPLSTEATSFARRRRGLSSVIDWLAAQPGGTWQERWACSGAEDVGNAGWWRPWLEQLQSGSTRSGSSESVTSNLRVALLLLVCADVIRPSLGWLLRPALRRLWPQAWPGPVTPTGSPSCPPAARHPQRAGR